MDRTESFGISLSCDWLSCKIQLWPQCLSVELIGKTGWGCLGKESAS